MIKGLKLQEKKIRMVKKKKSNIVDYIFWWFLKTFLMVETEIIILSDIVSACSSNIKENHT